MKRDNPGLKMVTIGASIVGATALAFGLASASGCSNVIGLSKDYYEEEASLACDKALAAVPQGSTCEDALNMQKIPGPYCIDKLEVTWEQYQAFLALDPSKIKRHDSPACQGDSLQPQDPPPMEVDGGAVGKYPVTGVDWCDAWAYCATMNKRLCGSIPDGAARKYDFTEASDCVNDEWYAACSAGGRYEYAEGRLSAGDARKCNVDNISGENKPSPVGTFKDCTSKFSPYLEIMDMNGNVAEWVNQCTFKADGSPIECHVRGGEFSAKLVGSDCLSTRPLTYSDRKTFVGIRCCGDLIKPN